MYNVSEEYSKAVEQPVRNFKITVRFHYQNAPQAVFEDDKIIGEVKIDSQAVSGSSTCGIIDIGAVPSATAELTIIDDDTDLHRYAGASFTVKVSLQLENGEYEDVPMGAFFCDTSKMSRVGNQITVFGYDSMTSLDYVIPDSHKRQIQGKSACDSVWVLVAYGHCGFNQDLSEFPNSDIPLDFSSPQVETARDAIMWIAQLMGCFARINRRNYLEFVPIKSTWEWLNEDHTLGTIIAVRDIKETARYNTKFSDDRIHIVGVSMPDQNNDLVTRGGGGLADDSNITISLEKNPLIANSSKPLTSILDDILTQLRTAYFYAFSAEITSDPALDAGDTIRLKGGMINGTNKNNDLIGFITHNVWRYCGKHEVINTGQTLIAYGSGTETAAIAAFSDDDTANTYTAQSGDDEPYYVAPRPQSEKEIAGVGGSKISNLVSASGAIFGFAGYGSKDTALSYAKKVLAPEIEFKINCEPYTDTTKVMNFKDGSRGTFRRRAYTPLLNFCNELELHVVLETVDVGDIRRVVFILYTYGMATELMRRTFTTPLWDMLIGEQEV